MLEMPATKAGRQTPKSREDLFFVTREATGESNYRALKLLAEVAHQFQKDPLIKKNAVIPEVIDNLMAQAIKDPAILTKMTSTIGVEQIA